MQIKGTQKSCKVWKCGSMDASAIAEHVWNEGYRYMQIFVPQMSFRVMAYT